MGNPNVEDITTSDVERQSLTMRMQMRRFTRLTNAFSKKVEYHLYAVALHFTHDNFCRPHMTLTNPCGRMHTTSAMAAGVAAHVWKLEEVAGLFGES